MTYKRFTVHYETYRIGNKTLSILSIARYSFPTEDTDKLRMTVIISVDTLIMQFDSENEHEHNLSY